MATGVPIKSGPRVQVETPAPPVFGKESQLCKSIAIANTKLLLLYYLHRAPPGVPFFCVYFASNSTAINKKQLKE
jgi:hypothetical protein